MKNVNFILFYLGYLFEVPNLFQEVNWYNLVFVLFVLFVCLFEWNFYLQYYFIRQLFEIFCFRNGAMSWALRDKHDVPGTQRLVEENSTLW